MLLDSGRLMSTTLSFMIEGPRGRLCYDGSLLFPRGRGGINTQSFSSTTGELATTVSCSVPAEKSRVIIGGVTGFSAFLESITTDSACMRGRSDTVAAMGLCQFAACSSTFGLPKSRLLMLACPGLLDLSFSKLKSAGLAERAVCLGLFLSADCDMKSMKEERSRSLMVSEVSFCSSAKNWRVRQPSTEQKLSLNSVGSAYISTLSTLARSMVTRPTSLFWSGLLLLTRYSSTTVSFFMNSIFLLSQSTSVVRQIFSLKSTLSCLRGCLELMTDVLPLGVLHSTKKLQGNLTEARAYRTQHSNRQRQTELSNYFSCSRLIDYNPNKWVSKSYPLLRYAKHWQSLGAYYHITMSGKINVKELTKRFEANPGKQQEGPRPKAPVSPRQIKKESPAVEKQPELVHRTSMRAEEIPGRVSVFPQPPGNIANELNERFKSIRLAEEAQQAANTQKQQTPQVMYRPKENSTEAKKEGSAKKQDVKKPQMQESQPFKKHKQMFEEMRKRAPTVEATKDPNRKSNFDLNTPSKEGWSMKKSSSLNKMSSPSSELSVNDIVEGIIDRQLNPSRKRDRYAMSQRNPLTHEEQHTFQQLNKRTESPTNKLVIAPTAEFKTPPQNAPKAKQDEVEEPSERGDDTFTRPRKAAFEVLLKEGNRLRRVDYLMDVIFKDKEREVVKGSRELNQEESLSESAFLSIGGKWEQNEEANQLQKGINEDDFSKILTQVKMRNMKNSQFKEEVPKPAIKPTGSHLMA